MITQFKIFETVNQEKLEVGDYVICYITKDCDDDELREFMNSNIGQICSIDSSVKYFPFKVKYDNAGVVNIDNILAVGTKEIIHHSKNKKELEVILTANKYNI